VVFHFYFPVVGDFKHFPSNVSVNGIVTARGGANDIKVVDSKKITKISNFIDILHAGTKDDVLKFLKTENLYKCEKDFSFDSMAYLCKDKAFFKDCMSIL
jgi:hypothetical protein